MNVSMTNVNRLCFGLLCLGINYICCQSNGITWYAIHIQQRLVALWDE